MVVKLRSKGKNVSFICCYAPQSGHSTETKEDFYDDLQTVYSECQEAVFLGGDFNARIHHRYDSELDIMGPNIFGRGREYLERVSSNTKENRDLLVDFCRANMLRILNTDFYKPLSKQATFRENATPVGGPITAENHAQLDFWLTHARQRNLCTDVQSRTDIYMQTDHYMVELSFRVKLSAAEHQKHNQVAPKFSKPSEYQWKQYNDFIHSRVSLAHGDLDIDQFAQTLMTAADICLSKDTVPRKKDYLSHRTWSLISDRQELFTQGLSDEVKALDRQIKKEARADKRRHIINQFHHAPGDPFRKRHGRLFINLDLISNHLMWPCVIPTVDGSHYQNEQKPLRSICFQSIGQMRPEMAHYHSRTTSETLSIVIRLLSPPTNLIWC
jgi:hypothetical protein